MQLLANKQRVAFYCCIVVFLIVNILTLKEGHNWGDDFAQYILNAQNILEHKPYGSGIMLEPWATVPPGFPLLIAGVLEFFGLNFVLLKLPNIFYWLLSVMALYPIAKKRLGEETAVLVSAILLSSPSFFVFKQNILSDVPFTFFVCSSIFLFMKSEEYGKRGLLGKQNLFLILALIFMGYASLVRYVGMLLLVTLVLYFLIYKKPFKLTARIIFLIGVLWAGQHVFGVTPDSHFEKLNLALDAWANLVFQNIPGFLDFICLFFFPFVKLFSFPVHNVLSFAIKTIEVVLFVGLLAVFFKKVREKNVAFWECFLVFYIVALTFWIASDRYVYPIVGLALIFILDNLFGFASFLSERMKSRLDFKKYILGFLLGILFLNIFFTVLFFNFNDDMINIPQSREMIEWIKTHTKSEQHLMFHKPRALRLLTGRLATPLWIYPEDQKNMPDRINQLRIDYLVTYTYFDQSLIDGIRSPEITLEPVWENQIYRIFQVVRN